MTGGLVTNSAWQKNVLHSMVNFDWSLLGLPANSIEEVLITSENFTELEGEF